MCLPPWGQVGADEPRQFVQVGGSLQHGGMEFHVEQGALVLVLLNAHGALEHGQRPPQVLAVAGGDGGVCQNLAALAAIRGGPGQGAAGLVAEMEMALGFTVSP